MNLSWNSATLSRIMISVKSQGPECHFETQNMCMKHNPSTRIVAIIKCDCIPRTVLGSGSMKLEDISRMSPKEGAPSGQCTNETKLQYFAHLAMEAEKRT